MCFPANISICFVLDALLVPVPEITVCDCCHSSPCAQRLVCVRTWKPHKSSWGSRVNALITVCIVHIQQRSRTFVGYLQFKEFIRSFFQPLTDLQRCCWGHAALRRFRVHFGLWHWKWWMNCIYLVLFFNHLETALSIQEENPAC